MRHRFLAALLLAVAASVHAADDSLLTAAERGTAIEAGRDLVRWVARPAGLPLDVEATSGAAENVKKLPGRPGMRLALVQADVFGASARAPGALRVVMPLYDEEVYFVVRADSALRFVNDIRGSRLNVGPPGSGSAFTASAIYRAMFGAPPDAARTTAFSNEQALLKLTTDRSVDVVVVVAGQPSRLFADMTPQARRYIKLLAVDPLAPETLAMAGPYAQGVIRSSVYPRWLGEDVPAFTVQSLLVTSDPHSARSQASLVRFAESMCENFRQLQAEGHPKWREVVLGQPPLPKGWAYYSPTRKVLSTCAGAAESRMASMIMAASGNKDARVAAADRCVQDGKSSQACRASAP